MAGSGTIHLREDSSDLVLQVEHLVVEYPSRRGTVHAVSDVSFDLADRETLGLVGESGCGKSTTGKAILRVPPPTSGRVLLDDVDLATLDTEEMRKARSQLQMIFQDAISSLNPRRQIRDVVGEPLEIAWLESYKRSWWIRLWERYVPRMIRIWRHPWIAKVAVPALVTFFIGLVVWVVSTALGPENADGLRDGGAAASVGNVLMIVALIALAPVAAILLVTGVIWLVLALGMPIAGIPRSLRIRHGRKAFEKERDAKVLTALTDVGIDAESAMDRRPHEFSGGQAQRISIARALVLDPKVIICDEPVSALDVSVQAQVLNLLEDLKHKYGISLVFIAHDLAVVKNIADKVVVMYLGKICEVAPPDELFVRPLHPYTEILMSSIPVTDPAVDPRAAITISGELPSPIAPPSGCRFRTRCPRAGEVCAVEEPELRDFGGGQYVACHFPIERVSSNGSVDPGRAVAATGGS
jgi:oligopeptide/dipeptide ABC transporter ATP-binding protein